MNFNMSKMVSWLPPASWGFKSCYVVLELFVSKYVECL